MINNPEERSARATELVSEMMQLVAGSGAPILSAQIYTTQNKEEVAGYVFATTNSRLAKAISTLVNGVMEGIGATTEHESES